MIPLAFAAVRPLSFARFRDTRKRGVRTSLCSTLVGFLAGWHARMSSRLAGKGACALSCASVLNIRLRPSPRLDTGGRQMRLSRFVVALGAFAFTTPSTTPAAAPARGRPDQASVTPPSSFLGGWLQVDRFPLGFKLSTLVARMQENHTAIRWQKGSLGWIMRATSFNQLTQQKHNLGFIFTEMEPGSGSIGEIGGRQLLLAGALVDGQEFVGRPLAAFANMTFQGLIGKDMDPAAGYPSREAYKADCPNRVAKKKAETAAQVAEWKRTGKYVPGWLDNGPDNRFDLRGNIFEDCQQR
ncbi:hypothetical protein [Sphingomonas sp. CROZ-RG-20F-R02-07]|uniref:hypothetical protein n=1 Tax=Sphingomonas sp. CROZ-RG-20F-R02-07 TaxID=2914832 RepID=UPI001F55F14B|nr:hypothetical protein [Sphingomonas sp. CROZ-RG-20F-R02-07]